jgi:hypothetical protein
MTKPKNRRQPDRRDPSAVPAASTPRPASRFTWEDAAIVAVLAGVALVRLRLLGVPFERDEGEYAYVGKLLLGGGLPYRDAYSMKLPGAYGMYALIVGVLGDTPARVHLGLLFVALAGAACLYYAVRRLFGPGVALVAGSVTALFALSCPFMGFAAHATQFIVLFVSMSLVFVARYRERGRWADASLAGVMVGAAFLMKQQAAPFVAAVVLVVAAAARLDRRVARATAAVHVLACGAGAAAPYLAVALAAWTAGIAGKFWLWTVSYAANYEAMPWAAAVPDGGRWDTVATLLGSSFGPMFAEYPALWLAALAGLPALAVKGLDWSQRVLAAMLAVAAAVAVSAGFYFRPHYFVVAAPAVGLLAGLGLTTIAGRLLGRWRLIAACAPFAVVLGSAAYAVAADPGYYLSDAPDTISRNVYGANPFVEAPAVGRYLAAHSSADERIAVFGSEPEILVYANRRSATGYMYVYPMFERQPFALAMQREMVAEVEAAKPAYVVYCNVAASWQVMPGAPDDLLQWSARYLGANHDAVGLVEIQPDGRPSRYYWDAAAQRPPETQNFLVVFKRK